MVLEHVHERLQWLRRETSNLVLLDIFLFPEHLSEKEVKKALKPQIYSKFREVVRVSSSFTEMRFSWQIEQKRKWKEPSSSESWLFSTDKLSLLESNCEWDCYRLVKNRHWIPDLLGKVIKRKGVSQRTSFLYLTLTRNSQLTRVNSKKQKLTQSFERIELSVILYFLQNSYMWLKGFESRTWE